MVAMHKSTYLSIKTNCNVDNVEYLSTDMDNIRLTSLRNEISTCETNDSKTTWINRPNSPTILFIVNKYMGDCTA